MTHIRLSRAVVLSILVLHLVAPAKAGAQGFTPATDGWDAASWRFGPFAVTPKLELRNLGWDSNVFADSESPKSDFTTTVAAPIDWWFRFGRARLHGVDTFEGVYFANYSDQGGFNQRHALTLLVPLNRVRPYIGGAFSDTFGRPGYEITDRVRQTESGFNGGAVIRVSSLLDLDVSGRQATYEYNDDDYAGNPYSSTLDRRITTLGAQVRYRITSLTTLTLLGENVSERYVGTPERDNDGYRVLPGVEFGEHALITGKLQVGYREFDTAASGMPDFSGLVATGELSYTLKGMTRITAGVSRDIHYSYSVDEPFYIQPGFTLAVTQQVAGPWDVQGRGSWYRLDYQRTTDSALEAPPERTDRYQTFGGGVGYKVGREIRVGFNVDYVRRSSMLPDQYYDGVRGGISVTYVVK